jgi:hypothetical protein
MQIIREIPSLAPIEAGIRKAPDFRRTQRASTTQAVARETGI